MVAFLFSAIGWTLPHLYVRYTPAEKYYEVSITGVDRKIYEQCDTIHYVVVRHSLVSSSLRVYTHLIHLIDGVTNRVEGVATEKTEGSIGVGYEILQRTLKIPCEAPNGTYFIERESIFFVDGIEKAVDYKSEPFHIQKGGVLP
jgi:hypothetical protein